MRFQVWIALVSVCIGITNIASAAQPTVGRVEPLGVQRGGLRTFVLKGARLKDAKQVLVYETRSDDQGSQAAGRRPS